MKNSLEFTAKQLVDALEKLGLKYFVPGSKDFALGESFLAEISQTSKFQFILSNYRGTKIKHKRWALLSSPTLKIYFLGVTEPSLLTLKYKRLFSDTHLALTKTIEEIKAAGYDPDDPQQRLVLLSHSGMRRDEKIARKFQSIDWIIGSHTQSFIQVPNQVGKTKIVQMLSRNHYMGDISLSFAGKNKDSYHHHEVRDELANKIRPNPFISWLQNHKSQLQEIQEQEQAQFQGFNTSNTKIPLTTSCTQCHAKQVQFWQRTAHSIAFQTLIQVKEERNLRCIGCHSVGFKKKSGFSNFNHAVIFEEVDAHSPSTKKLKSLRKSYWSQVRRIFAGKDSIRKLSKAEIGRLRASWNEIDTKFKVAHNFTNVQCLNCHNKDLEHPFDINDKPQISSKRRFQTMANNCKTCHTPDQSPEWYQNGKTNEAFFVEQLRKVACPKN